MSLSIDTNSPDSLAPHDACGIGAVIDQTRQPGKRVLNTASEMLCELDERGGMQDGSGFLFETRGLQDFFQQHIPPDAHSDGPIIAGNFFMPPNAEGQREKILKFMNEAGIHPFGFRQIPFQQDVLPANLRGRHEVWQALCSTGNSIPSEISQKLFNIKLRIQQQLPDSYALSLESGTTTYKFQSNAHSLIRGFEQEFSDPRFTPHAALLHRRYATFGRFAPKLAHPFRAIVHNGEVTSICAIRDAISNHMESLCMPNILMPGGGDTAHTDDIVTFFGFKGISLPESLRMMFQPSRDDIDRMPQEQQKYFYAARRALGTLAAFSDPAMILGMNEDHFVAVSGNMGFRPLFITITKDGLLIFSSEIGSAAIPSDTIERVFNLGAGQMMFVPMSDGRLVYPEEATRHIVENTRLDIESLATKYLSRLNPVFRSHQASKAQLSNGASEKERERLHASLNQFGADRQLVRYLKDVIELKGTEKVEGMSNSGPLAIYSKCAPRLAGFFKLSGVDILTPPLDYIREGMTFDLRTILGRKPDETIAGVYALYPQLELESLILTPEVFTALISQNDVPTCCIPTSFDGKNAGDMLSAIESVKDAVIKIAESGEYSIIILSDRSVGQIDNFYIPPILLTTYLHKELSRRGLRRRVSLVVDSGEALEPHDVGVLVGVGGADAISPYLLWQLVESQLVTKDSEKCLYSEQLVHKNFMATLKRFMAQIGVNTIDAFRAAKNFAILGLDREVCDRFLPNVPSYIGGLTLNQIFDLQKSRKIGGKSLRTTSEKSEYENNIRSLLEAIGSDPLDPRKDPDPEAYQRFIQALDIYRKEHPVFLRDSLSLNFDDTTPVDPELMRVTARQFIEDCRINSAGMSYGALSKVAHCGIARGMNRMNGFSNSGEGGEDPERYKGGSQEDCRSRIKQIGSGRYGVDVWFIVDGDQLEIKFSQGVKPRMGGDLPGEELLEDECGNLIFENGFPKIKKQGKTPPPIAKVRRVQPGQRLLSPPPQPTVFSIEDVKFMVEALKAVSPSSKIGAKVAASTSIGDVAVGLAKAGIDVISISGEKGKTGASPYSATYHAGLPVEIGISLAHQALVENGLRDLVRIRADEGFKCGEHIAKAILLGADEIAEGQALLIAAERCIDCNLCSDGASCPAGICGHGDEIEARMMSQKTGAKTRLIDFEKTLTPENQEILIERIAQNTVRYITKQAEDVVEILRKLGFASVEEAVGRVDRLKFDPPTKEAERLDLSMFLRDVTAKRKKLSPHELQALRESLNVNSMNAGNKALIDGVKQYLSGKNNSLHFTLKPTMGRHFGAALAGAIARKEIKMPSEGIMVTTDGYAGGKYGFAMPPDVTLKHTGFAGDHVGEALSGGKIVIKQPDDVGNREKNYVMGHVCGVGATAGTLYAGGKSGERLGFRNSGATIASEGCGKFGAEFMTGGTMVVFGKIGANFGVGMTGGEAYMYDEKGDVSSKIHSESVKIDTMNSQDYTALHALVLDFHKETGSKKAERILFHWDTEKIRFKKVTSTFRSSYTLMRDAQQSVQSSEFIFPPWMNPDTNELRPS